MRDKEACIALHVDCDWWPDSQHTHLQQRMGALWQGVCFLIFVFTHIAVSGRGSRIAQWPVVMTTHVVVGFSLQGIIFFCIGTQDSFEGGGKC